MTNDLTDRQLCAHELPARRDKDTKNWYEQGTAVHMSLASLLEAADILEEVLDKLN